MVKCFILFQPSPGGSTGAQGGQVAAGGPAGSQGMVVQSGQQIMGQSVPSIGAVPAAPQGGAGGNILVGPRPGIQVMAATPTGVMCTMTPEVWNQLYSAGLLNLQQPVQQPVMQQQQQQGTSAPPELQQSMLARFFEVPSGLQSASVVGPSMPKGVRAPAQEQMYTQQRSRFSWMESGRFLTEIRAEYDLSSYPCNSAVTFFILTYVEFNGIRRLIRTRRIPEVLNE